MGITLTNKVSEKMCGWCYGFNTFEVDINAYDKYATFIMYCSNCSCKTSSPIRYTSGAVTIPKIITNST